MKLRAVMVSRFAIPGLLTVLLIFAAACGGSSGGAGGGSKKSPTATPTATPTGTPIGTPTASPSPSPIPPLALQSIASGFTAPVDLEMPNDGTNRFFVVEQVGTIKVIHPNGTVGAHDFLDISSKVTSGGELGLLGMTFHPNYSTNGRIFVNYTRTTGSQIQTVIAEFKVSADPEAADPASEKILLVVDQPFDNHKAGQLAFGPDGFLYFGLGDGGSGGDPMGNGQNLKTLLGKMMRIDVDHTDAGLLYAIPPDNPFATSPTALHEIWAYGFRNPWRFSFERGTGRQFCADVGQDKFEEIDIVTAGGNFGWNVMEASHCFKPSSGCNKNGKILPITEYDHSDGRIAVIGGYVYKGSEIPALTDQYIFADFGSGDVWDLREGPAGQFTRTLLFNTGRSLSAFGQDTAGEIYAVDYNEGSMLKLVPE